ncbi:MAG: transcriptional regulator, AraC family [Gammaproteobacteria bacterium]|nr:transcriptional regulator, AraC family [Gammaproteobacteria bacterium]
MTGRTARCRNQARIGNIRRVERPKAKFAFLTLPRYSMIALSSAVEPLRMANLVAGDAAYDWSIVSADGEPTPASNGLQLAPTIALDKLGPVDILFVCGGLDVQAGVSPRILAALRRLAERRVPLGALCTGGYALAKAGLLDKYRATIHWENLSALREEFPRILLSDQLFTIDRDRFTCSGGVAPLDLMLHLIKMKSGARVSQLISEQFIVDRVRNDRDRQYIPLRAQIGVSHETLIRVAQLMEQNIEQPMPLDEIASATELSRRQIERLFKRHLNCVPKRYYLQMRLRRARELLLQTSMPIIDITTACGFQSTPHFSRCYRAQFGYPPSAERQIRHSKPAAGTSTPP